MALSRWKRPRPAPSRRLATRGVWGGRWGVRMRGSPRPSIRLVVTGTRLGRPDVFATLDEWADLFGAPRHVFVGDADGVDALARDWCDARGHEWTMFVADWKTHGHRAGPLRNAEMVKAAGRAAHLIAFPCIDPLAEAKHRESRGTWGCYELGLDHRLLCAVAGPSCVRELWSKELVLSRMTLTIANAGG